MFFKCKACSSVQQAFSEKHTCALSGSQGLRSTALMYILYCGKMLQQQACSKHLPV